MVAMQSAALGIGPRWIIPLTYACCNNDLPGSFTDMTGTADKLDSIDLSDKFALGANAPTTFMQVTINVNPFALSCLPKVFH